MKDLFYGILSFLLIISIYVSVSSEKKFENKEFNNTVVVEKDKDYFFGYQFGVKYPNDSVGWHRVYQIFYDKYNVGDTIKCR